MCSPKEMTRILIIGPKQSLESTISNLHTLKLLHIIDFGEPNKDFKRGQPLGGASEMSDSLVKLRSMSNILTLENESRKAQESTGWDKERPLRGEILTLELYMNENIFAKKEIEETLRTTRTKIETYRSFAGLGYPFEYYFGYQTLAVFTGKVKHDLFDIGKISPDYEVFSHESMIALFVPRKNKETIEQYLTERGFSPLEPPEKKGDPQEKLAELEAEMTRLESKLKEIIERLDRLRKKYALFIVQTEKGLAREVEKAEAPLMFASTDHSFIIDGWIPKEYYPTLNRNLSSIEGLFVSEIELESAEPPVLLDNPPPSKPFEMLVYEYSTPSYTEIDPTLILSFIFPLFFGFIIGDAGFGILIIGIGYYIYKKLWESLDMPGLRELSKILMLGGVFSILFGLFLYGEFLAIPFHSAAEAKINVGNWSDYLGINIPLYSIIHKIEDLPDLLILSIVAAGIHLGIGYILGIRNEWKHDKKHALAKFGWLIVLLGLFLEIMLVVSGTRVGGFIVNAFFPYITSFTTHIGRIPVSIISVIMIFSGIVLFLPAEGPMAILEIIGLTSNILSYTRLAGIAVAKAAIAIGITMIFLLVLHSGNILLIIVGGFLIFTLYAMVFLLGVIAAGIQTLRLNWVEFFRKFYQGNGSLFQPFGSPRKRS
jgi:V/A-type H+-transporting ATPase subunit I